MDNKNNSIEDLELFKAILNSTREKLSVAVYQIIELETLLQIEKTKTAELEKKIKASEK